MAEIILNIPDEKVQDLLDAIKELYPIPKIADPGWVDPDDGSIAPMIDQFTKAQWGKEFVRRFLIRVHYRYKKKLEKEQSVIIADDTLVS